MSIYQNQHGFYDDTMREYDITLFPELNGEETHNFIGQMLSDASSSPTSSSTDEGSPNPSSMAGSYQGPTASPHNNPTGLIVTLQHKPRGSKGVWEKVDHGQRIRVTKGKGKRLKLEIRISDSVLVPNQEVSQMYRLDKLQVELLDLETAGGPTNDGFSVESAKTFNEVTELEVKLFKAFCKRLKFVVHLPTVSGDFISGSSAEFASHNSGTLTTTALKSKEPLINERTPERSTPSPPSQRSQPQPRPSFNQQSNQQFQQQQQPQYSNIPTTVINSPHYGNNNRFNAPITTTTTTTSNYPHLPSQPVPDFKRKRVEQQQQQQTVVEVPPYMPDHESAPVTVVPGSLDVQGVVRARSYVQFSDMRLKTNFSDIVDAIDIVTKLKGQRYEWKPEVVGEENGGKKVIGLIAQEVRKVLPEVVYEDPKTGFLAVNYTEILPVLLQAFNQFLVVYKLDKVGIESKVNDIQQQVHQLEGNLDQSNKKQDIDSSLLLNQISFLSHELLKTQHTQQQLLSNQQKIEQQLESRSGDDPNTIEIDVEKRNSGNNFEGKSPLQMRGRFYYYLSGFFGLFLIGTIIGIVLLGTSGSPYEIQKGTTDQQSNSSTTEQLTQTSPTSTTGRKNPNASSGNSNRSTSGISSQSINDPNSITDVNETYIVGALLLSVGLVGMLAIGIIGGFFYRKDKQLSQSYYRSAKSGSSN